MPIMNIFTVQLTTSKYYHVYLEEMAICLRKKRPVESVFLWQFEANIHKPFVQKESIGLFWVQAVLVNLIFSGGFPQFVLWSCLSSVFWYSPGVSPYLFFDF